MEAREAELLPVEYFHVVFTLPAALGPIALQNPREVYGLLFRAAAETLQQIAADPEAPRGRDRLPGRPPHLGPEPPAPPPRPLRRAGRRALARRLALGRLPAGILPAGARAQPRLPGQVPRAAPGTPSIRGSSPSTASSRALADAGEFQRRLAASAQTEWVVYAKPPFGGPEQVLKYLARYTHRVAISNRRLVALEDGEVTFHWKDYAHGGGQKTMTLKATEFIRRFLLHVLPSGFVRIRHYGFLANRVCREKLALCRALLGVEATPEPVAAEPSAEPKEAVEGRARGERLPLLRRGPDGDRRDPSERSRSNRREWGPILEPAGFDTS